MNKKLLALLLIPIISYANNDYPFDPNIKGISMISIPNKLITQDKKDYIEKDNDQYIRFLLGLKTNAPLEIKNFKSMNILDTHLKNNYSEIKLSIPFERIKFIKDENIIGYAPIGGYENGWTGISMFFNDEVLGVCNYKKNKILAIQMIKEETDYIVNKKPSFKVIAGNINSGFIYNITWYSDKKDYVIMQELDCANKKLDKNLLDKEVELVNKLDHENV